jgi:hypothetical protein
LFDHSHRNIGQDQANGLGFIVGRNDYGDAHKLPNWKLRPSPCKRNIDGRVPT